MFIKLVHRNTLSCEAIVRRTKKGELLMVSQTDDITEPAPLNRVYYWLSKDDGLTWSERKLIIPEDGRAVYQTEVTVLENKIMVFLTFHNGQFLDFEHRVAESYDDGYSWILSDAKPYMKGFYFVRSPLRNDAGEYLFPFHQYPISKEENDKLVSENKFIWNIVAPNVNNGIIKLDRNGNFIGISSIFKIPLWLNGEKRFVWSEPTLAKTGTNEYTILLRVDKTGFLWKSISKDGGMTWSEIEITNIPNPANKPKLIQPSDDKIVLINTPKSSLGMNSRWPLEAWVSSDQMKTWEIKKTLVDFPGWISYPDGFIEDGVLYLAFEFNRHDVYFLKGKLY
jgi:hypothetical protein